MTRRLPNWPFLLLAVAALAAGAAWSIRFRPLAVETAAVAAEVPIQVFGLGTVEGRVVSRIGFEIGGSLVELHADAGERVARGRILARIDDREQAARLAKAEANVDRARADLATAAARVTRARALLAQARQVNQRRQELLRRAAVSVEAAEDAEAAVAVAAADLALAESGVAVAEAALRDAEAQRRLEEVLLGQHVLRAPFDAVVVDRRREPGTVLAPGEPLFTLLDPASVWIMAYVDEGRAGGLAVGQPAELRLRSLPGRSFTGRLARIDVESDRVSEERRVYVTCADCPPDMHLGEQAEVLIETGRVAQAVFVPQKAVENFSGRSGTVWTLDDGRLARRRVEFGEATLDGRLQIVGGLPAGAAVVIDPGPNFTEGRSAEARGSRP